MNGRKIMILGLAVAMLAAAAWIRCHVVERSTTRAATHPSGLPSVSEATETNHAPVAALTVAGNEAVTTSHDDGGARGGGTARDQGGTRFDVRWGRGGLCGGEAEPAKLRERTRLLESFEERAPEPLVVRADPATSPRLVEWILDEVRRPNRRFGQFFDEVPLPLTVYVYRDLEQLQRFACVNPAADAYYDGAIHVSAVPRDGGSIRNVITHELVHHALASRGVTTPMWLHEGLAMYIANERWWQREELQLVRWAATEHLPFDAMTRAFPDGADEAFARLAYFQSIAMVFAVVGGPNGGRDPTARIGDGASRIRTLIDDLAAGRIEPRQSFASMVGGSGEEDRAWNATVTRLASMPARGW